MKTQHQEMHHKKTLLVRFWKKSFLQKNNQTKKSPYLLKIRRKKNQKKFSRTPSLYTQKKSNKTMVLSHKINKNKTENTATETIKP
jgi:predicted transcriptional regulator